MSVVATPRSQLRWDEAQATTFTRWLNLQLRVKYGATAPVIKHLPNAFRDGIVLIKLIHALHPEVDLPPYNRKPRLRIHKLDNVSIGLAMAEQAKIALPHTNARHLVDAETKMVLGMVWIIVQSHQLRSITVEERTGKEGLLLWASKRTTGYKGVDSPLSNFTRDWQNGLVFAALIHAHRPELIDYDRLYDMHAERPVDVLQQTFGAAERGLGVPQLLDAEAVALVDRPDERSIITYVSVIFEKVAAASSAVAAEQPRSTSSPQSPRVSLEAPAARLASSESRLSGLAATSVVASEVDADESDSEPVVAGAVAAAGDAAANDPALALVAQAVHNRQLMDDLRQQIDSFIKDTTESTSIVDGNVDLIPEQRSRLYGRAQSLLARHQALTARAPDNDEGQHLRTGLLSALKAWDSKATQRQVTKNMQRGSSDVLAAVVSDDARLASVRGTVDEIREFLASDEQNTEFAAELLSEMDNRETEFRSFFRDLAGTNESDFETLKSQLQALVSGGQTAGAADHQEQIQELTPSIVELGESLFDLHAATWPLMRSCDGDEQWLSEDPPFDENDETANELAVQSLARFQARLLTNTNECARIRTQLQQRLDSQPSALTGAGPLSLAANAVDAALKFVEAKLARSRKAHRLAARVCADALALCQQFRSLARDLATTTLSEASVDDVKQIVSTAADRDAELTRVQERLDRARVGADGLAPALTELRQLAAELESTGEAPAVALQAASRVECLLTDFEQLLTNRTNARSIDTLLLDDLATVMSGSPSSVPGNAGSRLHQLASQPVDRGSTFVSASEGGVTALVTVPAVREACNRVGFTDNPTVTDEWLQAQAIALGAHWTSRQELALSTGAVARLLVLAGQHQNNKTQLLHAFQSMADNDCCIGCNSDLLRNALSEKEIEYLQQTMKSCEVHGEGTICFSSIF